MARSILAKATTAADFARNFAHWRAEADEGPVSITTHGKETHVLLPMDVFRTMLAGASRALPEDSFTGLITLSDWLQDAVVLCDRLLNIVHVNRIAAAIFRREPGEITGMSLLEAAKETRGSLLDLHLHRTAAAGEPTSAEIPSPFAEGGWIRFQTFSINDKVVLIIRDITEEVRKNRLADVKAAILHGMRVHGWIGYIQLTQRLTIDRADGPFCNALNLKEERLQGVSLVDLVVRDHKNIIREKLDEVASTENDVRFDADFLTNDGTIYSMSVAAVGLRGTYGAEGVVLLTTPAIGKRPGSQPD